MSKHLNSTSGSCRTAYLTLMIAAAALTAFTVKAQSWRAPHLPAGTTVSWSVAANPARAMQTGSQLQAEIITITPRGFEPLEITRAAGRFILMVDNHSGLQEVTFRLDQENGRRLYEIELPQEQSEWSEVVDLQPGTYLLTEANHVDWLSRLTITAE